MPSAVVVAAIGLFAGWLAGFLGAGGGFATVVLLMAAGLDAHDAVGTSLAFTIVIGGWGTFLHLRKGTSNPRLAVALGVPAALTALLGAQVAEALSPRTLMFCFAALAALVAVALLAGRRPEMAIAPISGGQVDKFPGRLTLAAVDRRRALAALLGGAISGFLSGLLGISGGIVLVPYMLLVLKIDEHIAVGTSLFTILIGSVVAASRHASLGNVDFGVALYAAPAGVLGSLLGVRMSHLASGRTLRLAFLALLVCSAAYTLARAI